MFIEQQNALGEYGDYTQRKRLMAVLIGVDHEPDSGTLPGDVTCFHEDYKHCGPDRPDWPRILYQYKPDDQRPCKSKPGKLLSPEGYVVLNSKNEPLLNFPSIPLTIASECKGWMLEAFSRTNKWATMKQIRSRMIGATNPRDGNLSMRMTRFRRKAGAITWGPSGRESEAFEDYMDQKLPQACKAANSIEGFRDLYPHEIAKMEFRNVGRRPNRARQGAKDSSDEKLRRKRAAALRTYKKLLDKFNAEHGQAIGEVDVGDEEDEEPEEDYEDEGEKAEDDGEWEWEEDDQRLNMSGVGDSESEVPPDDGNSIWHDERENESDHELLSEPASTHTTNGQQIQGLGASTGNSDVEGTDDLVDDDQGNGSDSSHSDSVEASDSEVGNFLYEDPTTAAESRLIQRLLIPTMTHFAFLMGCHPPETDPNRSYVHQWGDIATVLGQQFDEFAFQPPAFLLIGLVVFNAYTAEWNLPWDEERYGPRLDLEGLDVAVFAERALGDWS
jgi:hypothetical protein